MDTPRSSLLEPPVVHDLASGQTVGLLLRRGARLQVLEGRLLAQSSPAEGGAVGGRPLEAGQWLHAERDGSWRLQAPRAVRVALFEPVPWWRRWARALRAPRQLARRPGRQAATASITPPPRQTSPSYSTAD